MYVSMSVHTTTMTPFIGVRTVRIYIDQIDYFFNSILTILTILTWQWQWLCSFTVNPTLFLRSTIRLLLLNLLTSVTLSKLLLSSHLHLSSAVISSSFIFYCDLIFIYLLICTPLSLFFRLLISRKSPPIFLFIFLFLLFLLSFLYSFFTFLFSPSSRYCCCLIFYHLCVLLGGFIT